MRIMRVIVMFDLPTKTTAEKKRYLEFKRFLEEDGYIMEQFSVYSRTALGGAPAAALRQRLRRNVPPRGAVHVLELTERQYAARETLVDTRPKTREDAGVQLTLDF